MKSTHIGTDFDQFLEEEGLLAECEAGAIQRVLAWQIKREMKRKGMTIAKLANRMNVEAASIAPLFKKPTTVVFPMTFQFAEKVALALGKKLRVELA